MVVVWSKVLFKGFNAVTLYPFIVIREKGLKADEVLMNHEKIHLKQQLELLVVFFYLWYLLEYLYRLVQYQNTFLAYKNISFEREAYANDTNLRYVKTRTFWRFLKYL